jgi:hypothetical protein
MRLIIFIAFFFYSIVTNGQSKLISTYEGRYEWGVERINLFSNYTFNYKSSGCLDAGTDSGKYQILADTLVLNSFKPKEFVNGDFKFSSMQFFGKTKNGFRFQLTNSYHQTLNNIEIELDVLKRIITKEVPHDSIFSIDFGKVNPGSFKINFKDIGRQYSVQLDSSATGLISELKENYFSRKKEISVKQMTFIIEGKTICHYDHLKTETQKCLIKIKKKK